MRISNAIEISVFKVLFKRFEKATLNTSGKIISLVGANEAGKSSILEALTFLNHERPFNRDIHLTRGYEEERYELDEEKLYDEEHIVVEAAFILGKVDCNDISNLDISGRVRWLIVTKFLSGRREYEIRDAKNKKISNTSNQLKHHKSSK